MHVVVDDRHTADAVLRLHVTRSDGNVVDETEAHRSPGPGVMARRPHQGEGAGLGRLDRNAGGEQRGGPARLRDDGVGVPQARLGQGRQPVQVLGRVYTFGGAAFRGPPLARIRERLRAGPRGVRASPDGRTSDAAARAPDESGRRSADGSYAASAAIRSAWAFMPSCRTKEDASTHFGVWSTRGGRGAEASSVAIRR